MSPPSPSAPQPLKLHFTSLNCSKMTQPGPPIAWRWTLRLASLPLSTLDLNLYHGRSTPRTCLLNSSIFCRKQLLENASIYLKSCKKCPGGLAFQPRRLTTITGKPDKIVI